MELLITIAFFIMLLCILGVLVYFIYDYISYKEAVDRTIQMVNSSNLAIEASINQNRSALGILNKNIDTQDQRNTRTELNSQTTKGDLGDFDANLRYFMQFSSNVEDLKDKIFDYRFSLEDQRPDDYKLKLLKRVNAISGMTIESAPNKNLKICDGASDNCINLSMTNQIFDITPNTPTGMMTIKSASSSLPMAQFDFGQNNVYFGGSNIDSSPMYVKGNEVYLDKDRVKIKIPTLKHPNGVMSFDKMITENNDIKRAMNTMNSAIWQSSSNIEVLGQYILTTTTGTLANTFTYNLEIILLPLYNIPANTALYVELSTTELGATGIDIGNVIQATSSTPQMGTASMEKSNNMLKITINTPATSIEKDRQIIITFTLPNATVFIGASLGTKSGTTIARRTIYPDDYPPRLSQNAINNIL
jgi:hypothetical protein